VSENQKTLLQQALDMLEEQALHIEAPMLPAGEELLKRIRAAISLQAEQAPVQDEREAVERFSPTTSVPHCGRASEVEAYMTEDDDGEYMTVSQHERIVAALTRPAQTEQQPVAVPEGWKLVPVQPTAEMLAAVTTSTFEPLRQEAMKMAREDYQAMLYAAPIAQTEQQPAYVECRECTDCGHVGINDAHPTDATCAMCDWSGPSPVEDQCPDCGKENAMGAACPKCSGRYRILAETHVAAPIAQTGQQPVLSNCLDLVEKMTVSVDVSTGDDDAFNRLFCKVAGVQEESDGSWTILAVDPEPNFAAPIAQTEQQPKHSGLVTEAMRNAAIAEYSRHDGDFSDFADSVIRAALSAGGRDE